MAKRVNPKQELVSFVIDGTFTTIAISCGKALYDGVDTPLLQSALIGFGGIASLAVLSRRWPWRNSARTPRWDRAFSTFEKMVPAPGGGYVMKWKEKDDKPEEFVFSGCGLPVPIPASTLGRFLGIARRRQLNALYDTKFAMRWTGNGYTRTKVNWVLSQNHYTKFTNPRWPEDEYFSCLLILGYTRLMIGRGSGSSGRLFGSVGEWSTEHYTRLAIDRWLSLSPKSNNLFQLLSTYINLPQPQPTSASGRKKVKK